jgi:hypothetical protein
MCRRRRSAVTTAVALAAIWLCYTLLAPRASRFLAAPAHSVAWIPANDSGNLLKAHPARGLDTLGWSVGGVCMLACLSSLDRVPGGCRTTSGIQVLRMCSTGVRIQPRGILLTCISTSRSHLVILWRRFSFRFGRVSGQICTLKSNRITQMVFELSNVHQSRRGESRLWTLPAVQNAPAETIASGVGVQLQVSGQFFDKSNLNLTGLLQLRTFTSAVDAAPALQWRYACPPDNKRTHRCTIQSGPIVLSPPLRRYDYVLIAVYAFGFNGDICFDSAVFKLERASEVSTVFQESPKPNQRVTANRGYHCYPIHPSRMYLCSIFFKKLN